MTPSNSGDSLRSKIILAELGSDLSKATTKTKSIIILSLSGKIISINKCAKEFVNTHLAAKLKPGSSILDIIPDKELQEFIIAFKNSFIKISPEIFSLRFDVKREINFTFSPQIMEDGTIAEVALFLSLEDSFTNLSNSQRKFKSIFDNSPLGIFFSKPDGTILDCNKAGNEMFNYTVEEFQRVGRDSLFKKDEKLKQVLKKRKVNNFIAGELTGIKKDGSLFPVEVYSSIYLDKDGTEYTSTVLIDMTAQREQEIAFNKTAQVFASLFNQHPDAVYSFDLKGNFISVNNSALELAETSKEEILKLSFLPFIESKDQEKVMKKFQKALKGDILNYNASFISAKGTRKTINITNFPIITNKDITGVFGIARDITQTERIKKKAESAQKRFKKILDQSVDIICTFSPKGKFIDINTASISVLGYLPKEMIGKNQLEFISDEDKPATLQMLGTLLKEKEITSFTNYYIGKDGKVIPLIWSLRFDVNDDLIYGVAKNASEIKRVQNELLEEKNLLRTIIDNIPDYIYVVNKEQSTILSNKAFFETYLGRNSENEILGLQPTDYFSLKDGLQTLKDNKRIIQNFEKVINREVSAYNYSDKKETILLTKVPFRDSRGHSAGLVSIARNITAEKMFQEEQKLISNIIKIFNKTLSLKIALKKTINLILNFLEFDAAEAWEVGYSNLYLSKIADYNINSIEVLKEINTGSFEKGEGLAGTVWKNREIEIWKKPFFSFLGKDAEKLNNEIEFGIGVPIIYSGDVISVFTFFDKEKRDRKNVKSLLSSISLQISSAVQQKITSSQLTKIFTYSPNLMGVIGVDGYLKRVNPAFTKTCGFTEEELLTTPFNHFIHPKDLDATIKVLKDAKKGKLPKNFENRCLTKSGDYKWISWQPSDLLREEGVLQIYGKDITEEKQAAQEIRLAKERYDLFAKATNEAVYDWDISKNFLDWNDVYSTVYGYKRKSSSSTLEDWEANVHPDDITEVKKGLELALKDSERSEWLAEYRFIKNDNTFATVLERGYILRDDSGKAIRMIGSLQNITQLKLHEQELEELNKDLKKQAQELAASNAELEQFAYVASHDLQEPLRMVTSFLNQLQKKYRDQLDDKANQYIFFATDGAVRMRKIILDLLEYSRVGKLDYQFEQVDLNELLGQIKQLHENMFSDSQATLQYNNLPQIYAARTPIQRLLSNLISNAIKYQKKEVSPEIFIEVINHETEWEILVRDNGIGIDKQFFNKIFIIFQRLHAKDAYSGTGIGLAICKKIVENHEGRIWVTSEEGKGSTFHFTIKKLF